MSHPHDDPPPALLDRLVELTDHRGACRSAFRQSKRAGRLRRELQETRRAAREAIEAERRRCAAICDLIAREVAEKEDPGDEGVFRKGAAMGVLHRAAQEIRIRQEPPGQISLGTFLELMQGEPLKRHQRVLLEQIQRHEDQRPLKVLGFRWDGPILGPEGSAK